MTAILRTRYRKKTRKIMMVSMTTKKVNRNKPKKRQKMVKNKMKTKVNRIRKTMKMSRNKNQVLKTKV
jgi:hypothetical protein